LPRHNFQCRMDLTLVEIKVCLKANDQLSLRLSEQLQWLRTQSDNLRDLLR
jgi:hypothetical protein